MPNCARICPRFRPLVGDNATVSLPSHVRNIVIVRSSDLQFSARRNEDVSKGDVSCDADTPWSSCWS